MSSAGRFMLQTPVLRRVEALAAQLLGTSLVVLARHGEDVARLDFGGCSAPLPKFCTLMRSAPHGDRHCLTCRRLITLSVHFRGLTTYSCHGGVQIVAAPVQGSRDRTAMPLVVATSAFAHGDPAQGWKAVQAQVRGTRVRLASLREAYHALPVLSEANRETVQSLVDLAAVAVAEALRDTAGAEGGERCSGAPERQMEGEMRAALGLARAGNFTGPGIPPGTALTDLVVAMIERDPTLPFTVADVARAARMSPNHFSTLFHKNTGCTFVAFLAGQRLNRARTLLQDPTLSVQEVAEMAGFQDSAYFSRRFKQMTGCSPSEWRENAASTG